MYSLTLKGQGQIWPQVKSGQGTLRYGDPSRSNYTSFDAPSGEKRNDTNPSSLTHLDLNSQVIGKKLLVTSSDLHDI